MSPNVSRKGERAGCASAASACSARSAACSSAALPARPRPSALDALPEWKCARARRRPLADERVLVRLQRLRVERRGQCSLLRRGVQVRAGHESRRLSDAALAVQDALQLGGLHGQVAGVGVVELLRLGLRERGEVADQPGLLQHALPQRAVGGGVERQRQ